MMIPRSMSRCLGLAALSIVLAACSSNKEPDSTERFFTSDEASLTTQTLETQAARGARLDATLYPQHFDEAALNSLGRAKLDLMLKDSDSALPLVVFLDLPAKDARTAPRRDAVRTYLSDAGLLASQFKLESGPNPATCHPVAPDLMRLPKTETGSAARAGIGMPADPPAASPAPASSVPPGVKQ